MRVLILGITGMLGHTLFRMLKREPELQVWGTVRNLPEVQKLPAYWLDAVQAGRIIEKVDAYNFPSVVAAIQDIRPDVVINCIGLIRHLPEGNQPWPCIEINARLPHLLLRYCQNNNIRLVHYSTDCVFNGHKGAPYSEDDAPSANDVYGMSKYLGELHESPALTIRTSIIGHELRNGLSLIDWFLAQEGTVHGYNEAVYSGLPTTEHAMVLMKYVLPNHNLSGLYQVAASPISKYNLLKLTAKVYGKNIAIVPDGKVVENKTLVAEKFRLATGYVAPSWETMLQHMRDERV